MEPLIGNQFVFKLGSEASPTTFADMCAVIDISELGEEKPIVDITSLCDQARTYRNGLADGLEIPLRCNFNNDDTQIQDLYNSFKADEIRSFQLATTTTPADTFDFRAQIRSWRLSAPVGDKSVITFGLKISGGITWSGI